MGHPRESGVAHLNTWIESEKSCNKYVTGEKWRGRGWKKAHPRASDQRTVIVFNMARWDLEGIIYDSLVEGVVKEHIRIFSPCWMNKGRKMKENTGETDRRPRKFGNVLFFLWHKTEEKLKNGGGELGEWWETGYAQVNKSSTRLHQLFIQRDWFDLEDQGKKNECTNWYCTCQVSIMRSEVYKDQGLKGRKLKKNF